MYFVYVIESQTSGKLYIGQTNDPVKRLNDHNRGASPYTKGKGPFTLIFLKEFPTRTESLAYEKLLKSWKSPSRIKAMINRESVG